MSVPKDTSSPGKGKGNASRSWLANTTRQRHTSGSRESGRWVPILFRSVGPTHCHNNATQTRKTAIHHWNYSFRPLTNTSSYFYSGYFLRERRFEYCRRVSHVSFGLAQFAARPAGLSVFFLLIIVPKFKYNKRRVEN